jgi:two-component sensor histidine kinase
VGIPEDFEPHRAGSLGLEIVRILTRQLKGTFAFDRSSGATFRIQFPDPPAETSPTENSR